MAKQYNTLPSIIMGIEDCYTAFCFNEACANITQHLMNEEKPQYKESNGKEQKEYKTASELYSNIKSEV